MEQRWYSQELTRNSNWNWNHFYNSTFIQVYFHYLDKISFCEWWDKLKLYNYIKSWKQILHVWMLTILFKPRAHHFHDQLKYTVEFYWFNFHMRIFIITKSHKTGSISLRIKIFVLVDYFTKKKLERLADKCLKKRKQIPVACEWNVISW